MEETVFYNCKLTGSAEYLFYRLESVKKIDLSGFDTKNVTDMMQIFYDCDGLTSLDLSSFVIGSSVSTNGMLAICGPSVLKAPKQVDENKKIYLSASYRDAEGKVYRYLTAENAGKELTRVLALYKIQLDRNGADGGSTAGLSDCQVGTSYKLPANGFTCTGYIFARWNTKKNGTGKNYKNREQVKNLTSRNGKTVVLYARWTRKK